MKRDYIDFQDRSSPIGYLITFRCYGTWLHGDERGSVDRHHRVYDTPGLPPSRLRRQHDRDLLKQPPVKLNPRQRLKTSNYDVVKYSRTGETLETLGYAIKGRDMAESICEMKQRQLTPKEIEDGVHWLIPILSVRLEVIGTSKSPLRSLTEVAAGRS